MNPVEETFTARPFELAGRFAGFVFTETGKRRMHLRDGEDEHLLKVPRTLRRRLIGKFQPGQLIRVAGIEEQDPVTARLKRVVSRVLPDTAAASPEHVEPPPAPTPVAACPIRVCAKKNCWRQGGRELWEVLNREVTARGLAGQITLRQVGCLDRCKHAPNVDCGGHAYTRCAPADAARMIARAVPGHFAKKQSSNAGIMVGCAAVISAEIL